MKLSTLAAVAPVVAMLLAMGCASSELVQPAVVAPPAFAFTNVDGYDFYEDSASGELIPPSSGPRAHIERETSVVVMNCDVDQCNAAYKSEHFGMWHKTSQTMHWSLQDFSGADLGGGSPTRTGGAGCANWLGGGGLYFCYSKRQANVHHLVAPISSCYVKATLSTDHLARWSLLYTLSAGYISIEAAEWGENSTSSIATPAVSDYHCDELPDSSCDNPFTETVEPCTLYETGGTQKMELGDFDGLQHTQNSDGVMMECEVWEWYVSNDGGKTKTYSHTTYENCQVLAQ